MTKGLGFAVVGLGMGKQHCRSIQEADGAYLVAVCDTDEERLNPISKQYECKAYTNFEDLLKDDAVKIINLATPSGMHSEMGSRVVDSGKHLIVEKPADITAGRIDLLQEAGRRNGVKIGCIFQARLDLLNIRIQEAIVKGKLGKLVGVHGHLPWWRAQTYYEGPHGIWKGTWGMDGGGSLMNQGVHTVDLLQWLGGKVKSVMGMFGVFGHDIESEDQSVALLKFVNGALGTIYTTTCCYPGYDQLITIYGSKGSIMKDASELLAWKVQGDKEVEEEIEMLDLFGKKKDKLEGVSADPMAVSTSGHTQIIEDLVQAIKEDRDPIIGLESARHAVEIINAVFESGRTGKEVEVK